MQGFQTAEEEFITKIALSSNNQIQDRSGSCAIILLIIGKLNKFIILDDDCYIANVGDSRAIMSTNAGTKMIVLSTDHKPNNEDEKKRIISEGGKIYQ